MLVRTFVRPPEFIRKTENGMDAWNDDLKSYGSCWDFNSPDFAYFCMVAGVFNSVLLSIIYLVYRTRHIHVEYNELLCFGFASISVVQCELICIPIAFTMINEPISFYVLTVSYTLVQSMTVLIFIFLPKWYYMRLLKEKEKSKKYRG